MNAETPRIPPVDDPDPEQAELLAKTLMGPGGRPLNIFATLARHPRLLKRVNALGGLFMAHGSHSARDREIVILRTGFRVGSEYEWAQHVVIGRKAGLTDDEIERARRPERDGEWSDDDRLLLAVADELSENDDLSDATWEALTSRFEEAQILELIMMVGFYRMLGGYLRSVRVQVEQDG